MGLQQNIEAAAASFIDKVAQLVTDATRLRDIVTGPASGAASLVNVGTATLKTIARILAEAIGRLGPNKGAWNSATAYDEGDIVTVGLSLYYAGQANTNVSPTTQGTGPDWFILIDAALIAPIASPNFTGVPTAPTAALGTNTNQISSCAFVQAAIAALVSTAPGVLDTLDELAAALGDDANFAATVTTALAGKVPTSRTVSTSGLATGGGDLSADRTIDVPKASQAEAEAGSNDTKAMTALKVAQAIAALGGSGMTADEKLTLALLQLEVADLANHAIFSGAAANRFADSFDTLTNVNTGGSTNLDTGEAGKLKPATTADSLIPRTDGTIIGDMTNHGGVAAAFDGTTSQAASASAGKDANANGYGNNVGKDWGAGVTHIISRFIYYGPNNNSALGGSNTTQLKLQGSNDGTNWTDLTSDINVGSSFAIVVDVTSGIATSTAYRYHRLNVKGNGGVNGLYCAEVQFYQLGSTNNAIAKSTGLAAAAAPTQMRVLTLVEHTDAATPGTDYKFKVSRNGGTNLSSYISLNERFTVPGSSIHVIESDIVDVSGLTSGTAPFWQWETFNNKMVKLQAVYLFWQ